MKEKIGYNDFDTIYIARDYGSFGTQLILNSYPNARRVEYGDSFGLVGSEEDLMLSFKDAIKSPVLFFKTFLKRTIYQHYPKRFEFDLTVLSIPIDWSGKYLTDKNIIIPSKQHVTNVILTLADVLTDLKDYCNSIVQNDSNYCTLILLSNFANSGFCTFDNEVELYYQTIKTNVPKGNTVILKNHPRGNPKLYNELVEKIKPYYKVKIICDKYNLYPIELWAALIQKCKVIPIFSSSTISINYVYSKEIILTLDNQTIKKFIYKEKQLETEKAELMNKSVLLTLKDWDGKSPVWKGTKR